jgi:hypothetical protein
MCTTSNVTGTTSIAKITIMAMWGGGSYLINWNWKGLEKAKEEDGGISSRREWFGHLMNTTS